MIIMSSPAVSTPRDVMLVIENAGHQRRMMVSKWPFTIGRGEDCDVTIPDFRVSRLHARLEQKDSDWFVVDAGSRHGTFVNGKPAQPTPLKNNDEITLGVAGLKL